MKAYPSQSAWWFFPPQLWILSGKVSFSTDIWIGSTPLNTPYEKESPKSISLNRKPDNTPYFSKKAWEARKPNLKKLFHRSNLKAKILHRYALSPTQNPKLGTEIAGRKWKNHRIKGYLPPAVTLKTDGQPSHVRSDQKFLLSAQLCLYRIVYLLHLLQFDPFWFAWYLRAINPPNSIIGWRYHFR